MAFPASVPRVVIGSYALTVFRQAGALYDQDHARSGARLPPRCRLPALEDITSAVPGARASSFDLAGTGKILRQHDFPSFIPRRGRSWMVSICKDTLA